MTPAQALTKSVREYLALHGWLTFKVGSGALRVQDRFVRLSTPGAPDLVAVREQEYALIEIKAGKDRMSHTQKLFQDAVKGVKGNYRVVRSLDDVDDMALHYRSKEHGKT